MSFTETNAQPADTMSYSEAYTQLTDTLNRIVRKESVIDFACVVRFGDLVQKNLQITSLDDLLVHTEISGANMRLVLALLKLETWYHEINSCRADNIRVGTKAVYRLTPTNSGNADGETIMICSFDASVDANVLRAVAKFYQGEILTAIEKLPSSGSAP